ncbi:MAG: SDR family NAD(P)-dependent oxidoreductase, partial [Bacteroidales bacterium]|nr:SDR family NAD(P)-dependent oxidoreductase [Bacteroidales bacterium]
MVLITGSTGLLGAHTLYRLLQQHDRVAALKRSGSNLDTLREIFSFYTDDIDPLMHRIEWREGDLLDRASIDRALKDVDVVVNCAAIVSFNPRDRKQLIENNVEGTRNLVEAIVAKRENKVKGVDKSGG